MKAGYKLFRRRADGTIGSLFIDKGRRVPVGVWLRAEDHPTNGYTHRPGWHAFYEPVAPHLRQDGDRVWCRVLLLGCQDFERPASQGGTWILAQRLKVLEVCGGQA